MLSVAIIARDEERHIGAALASVRGLADEVVVLLDARTSDRTAEVCRAHGARVFVEPWRGFPAQRNRALDLCQGAWVLFLDADERVGADLRLAIGDWKLAIGDWKPVTNHQSPITNHQLLMPNDQPPIAGYWLPRHNQFFGQTLRGGGWYPDEQLRLLRRGAARYDEARQVHEYAVLDGATARLAGHLLHLNIERWDELWRKQTHYALHEAQTLYRAGRRARWRNFVGAPLREFQRRYLALGGWRDGRIGLLLCATLTYFEIVKFAHLKGLELHGDRRQETRR